MFDHWKNIIDTEFGSDLTTRTIVLDDQDLIKVTLGDGTENITIAKKINNCLSDAPTQTIAFSFPGIADPIETGIMSGPENPVAHYAYDGRAYNFANLIQICRQRKIPLYLVLELLFQHADKGMHRKINNSFYIAIQVQHQLE